MIIKILIISSLFINAVIAPAWAEDQFGGFKQYVDGESLKPFTRDLGSVLGSATFHSGRPLGFSGFDVGARGGLRLKPHKDNKVLRDRGVKAFGLPWVQAEIGLPFRLDGYIRGISFQGLTIAGGGLRWSIRRAVDKPRVPQFLLAWSGHSVTHRDFTASHFGLNLISSITMGWMTPYFGVGADRTTVVVRCIPDRNPNLEGASTTTTEPRFTAGFSIRPKTYIYLHAAFTTTDDWNNGFSSGIGIRF
ncbi:MAG TPA: hypothetical protein DD417_01845 [Elusimicrobia bacterium]|nr:hypothetical protein [Elusimicrobiota bacterium]